MLPATTAAGGSAFTSEPGVGDYRDRGERAAGCRQVRFGEAAQDEVAGRPRDRKRAVEVPGVLRRGSREVELDLRAADLDRDPQLELAVDGLEHVGRLASARSAAGRSPPGRAARSSRRARPSPPRTLRRPRRSTSSVRRRSARRCAAIWARRSPRRSSGLRVFARKIRTTSSVSSTGGSTSPSWKSSRENAGRLAGSIPPTSA